MSHFNQIDEGQRTESLRPIGVLALSPDELAERYGLTFQLDERDGSAAAMLRTDHGDQYMLLHHVDAPYPGTEVHASDQSTEPEQDLEGLLKALDLRSDSVTWKLSREDALASRQVLAEARPRSRDEREPRRRAR